MASAHVMVTKVNGSMQGFLVSDLHRMVHCAGASLMAPTSALGSGAGDALTRIGNGWLAWSNC